VAEGGLGLSFALRDDGSVAAEWLCPAGGESYAGIVHGGVLATALDSAMVHCLFARDIVARTGELTVRYRRSVRSGAPVTVTACLRESFAPLHYLEAEIRQDGSVCAQARAKFMAVDPDSTNAITPSL
jgi:acyl-coenzyme A thioesterase PaaI-like protein